MAFGRLGSLGAGFGRFGAGAGGVAAPAGGAALLVGETDGFAVDFTHATDASRVAVKTAGVVASQGLNTFFQNGGTSPKLVFDVSGVLVWVPHNIYIQSATPATRSVTTVVGFTYTVSVVGSGSLTGSSGAAGVATQASPLTYTATGVTSTFTLAGSLTQVQMNRGTVATAHLPTTATVRYGLAIDYDPVTHASKGLLLESAATNLLLNSTTLSTQSVTVTAAAHTLSFFGTGTVTLTGTSTAGPLVGTGASNRVSLTFTPTAGSLTLTVSGTVSNAQLETGSVASSVIPTAGATVTRAGDNYTFLLSTIPALGSEYSLYGRFAPSAVALSGTRFAFNLTDGGNSEVAGLKAVSGLIRLDIIDNSVQQCTLQTGSAAADTFISAAARVKLNDCTISVAGAAAMTPDTAVTLPTVTEVRFGAAGAAGPAFGTFNIAKMMIVPRAWSNAELPVQSAVT